MATTTEIQPQTPVLVPPATPKRAHRPTGKVPTGRPVAPKLDSDEDDENDELAALSEEVEDWQLHCRNITEDEWTQTLCYLKRIAPTNEKRSSGRSIETASYCRSFTMEDLKKEHGSGVYRLRFLRMTQPSGKFRKYRDYFVDIMDPKYPPNLPYGEWIDRPENEAWKWAGPALLARQQEEAAKVGAPMPVVNGVSGAYPPGLNFNELLLRVTEANDPKKLVEFFKTMTPPPDTTTSLILGKLLDATLQKPAAPGENTATDKLLQMLLDDRKADRERMDKMQERLNAPVAPQPNIVEQFIALKPAIAELVPLFSGRVGKTDVWAGIAEKGIEQIPELIQFGREALAKTKEAAPVHAQQRTIQATAAPVTQPATQQPSAAPTADTPEAEARKYVDAMWQQYQPLLLMIYPRLMEMFKTAEYGYAFREWFLKMHGELNWVDLKRDIPPELLFNMYVAHPKIKAELAPTYVIGSDPKDEKLLAFLTEFLTRQEDEPAGLLIEDDEPTVEVVNGVSATTPPEAKTKRTRKGAQV